MRDLPSASPRRGPLIAVKLLHTLAWVFFVACIIAMPFAAWRGEYHLAAWFGVIVMVEVAILAFNRWACPLTPVAARYTDDRRANFDIYLPEWLAHYNKQIFGALYVAGLAFSLWCWWRG